MYLESDKVYRLFNTLAGLEREQIEELSGWLKKNVRSDLDARGFSWGNFADAKELKLAVSGMYKFLGVAGVRGKATEHRLCIADGDKDKLYLIHLNPISAENKRIFMDTLGLELKEFKPNISRLKWRVNGHLFNQRK